MAGKYAALYRQEFTSTDTIVVAHNLGLPALGLVIRVVVNNMARPDLISQAYPTPTDPTNSLTVLLTSAQTGYVQVLDADIVKFASGASFTNTFNYGTAESDAESGTNSTTYVQKLRLTTINLPEGGNYLIQWSFSYSQESNSAGCLTRIQIDDTTTIAEYQGAPNITYAQGGYYPAGGYHIGQLAAGVHNIDFDFASSIGNKTAYVRNVHLAIWKVD